METPKTDRVVIVFYKDNEKPNFMLFSIEEIAEHAGYHIPTNPFERSYFLNFLRQCVYTVRKWEWEDNGRLLVSVKESKGQPVKYGFTKKVAYLINNFKRKESRVYGQMAQLKQLGSHTQNILPENKQYLLKYEQQEMSASA